MYGWHIIMVLSMVTTVPLITGSLIDISQNNLTLDSIVVSFSVFRSSGKAAMPSLLLE